ncbi:MAG: hypothetical protein ABI867_30240 [Kofleriaceae bacterium]
MGLSRLGSACCLPGEQDFYNLSPRDIATACAELDHAFLVEPDPSNLEKSLEAVRFGNGCHGAVPAAFIANVCQAPRSCSYETRKAVLFALATLEPDLSVVQGILSELDGSRGELSDADAQALEHPIAYAMSGLGEAELAAFVSWTGHRNPRIRRIVIRGFRDALEVPLDLRGLTPALERASLDPNRSVAVDAQIALDLQDRARKETPAEAVARTGGEFALTWLAVRRYSCRTPTAVAAMTRLAASHHHESAELQRALELRQQRCRLN